MFRYSDKLEFNCVITQKLAFGFIFFFNFEMFFLVKHLSFPSSYNVRLKFAKSETRNVDRSRGVPV